MKFPGFSDTQFMEHIDTAVRRLNTDGLKVFQFLKTAENWESHYTFREVDKEYCIEELKVIVFPTLANAKLYAFLDYCSKRRLPE